MSQEELDLFHFAARCMAQLRTGPALMPHAALYGAMPNAGLCRITQIAFAGASLNLAGHAA